MSKIDCGWIDEEFQRQNQAGIPLKGRKLRVNRSDLCDGCLRTRYLKQGYYTNIGHFEFEILD